MKERRERVVIFDTTLRDGEQSPGATLTKDQKLVIGQQLRWLGVDVIEAGFPISSIDEAEAVRQIAAEVKGPIICALARALRKDIAAAADALGPAISRGQGRIHTFIATSDEHLKNKLLMTREQVLKAAHEAVQFARTFTDDVQFSCEDAGRTDPGYLLEVCQVAARSGATTINIPDTVGYKSPWDFERLVAGIVAGLPPELIVSVHCHDDRGLAVANSLAGLRAGARQVECTINGIGERAGNAALEELVMNLRVDEGLPFFTNIDTTQLCPISAVVSRLTGIRVQPNKSVVGANAFAHEAGIHQDGVLKNPATYEIMSPDQVGWAGTSMALGKHSGRHVLKQEITKMGMTISSEQLDLVYEQFKALCDKKKHVYVEDLRSIVLDQFGHEDRTTWHLQSLSYGHKGAAKAEVVLKRSSEQISREAAGDGAVDAVMNAINQATDTYPRLHHYEVVSATGESDAVALATVTLKMDDAIVTRVSQHTDVVWASAIAYLRAINALKVVSCS